MANYPNPSQMMKAIEQVVSHNLSINTYLIHTYMSVDPDNGGLILTATAYGKSFLSIRFGMETDLDGLTELVEAELGIQKLLGTIPTDPKPKSAQTTMSVPTPMNLIRPERFTKISFP